MSFKTKIFTTSMAIALFATGGLAQQQQTKQKTRVPRRRRASVLLGADKVAGFDVNMGREGCSIRA